jgi:PIN domain nuclease of toxin-antitoxin system
VRFLLDTHGLLYWVYDPRRLGVTALKAITDRDNVIYWSVASS